MQSSHHSRFIYAITENLVLHTMAGPVETIQNWLVIENNGIYLTPCRSVSTRKLQMRGGWSCFEYEVHNLLSALC
jgi:hypothetical protein